MHLGLSPHGWDSTWATLSLTKKNKPRAYFSAHGPRT